MSKNYAITTERGVPMNIQIIDKGDIYGLRGALRHNKDNDPLIEFRDARHISPKEPQGQMISRYYISTLLKSKNNLDTVGMCLDGRVPEWDVDGASMRSVLEFARNYLSQNKQDQQGVPFDAYAYVTLRVKVSSVHTQGTLQETASKIAQSIKERSEEFFEPRLGTITIDNSEVQITDVEFADEVSEVLIQINEPHGVQEYSFPESHFVNVSPQHHRPKAT